VIYHLLHALLTIFSFLLSYFIRKWSIKYAVNMFSRKIVYGDLTSMNFNALLIFTSLL
jgi:hypothetical protein